MSGSQISLIKDEPKVMNNKVKIGSDEMFFITFSISHNILYFVLST